MVVRRDGVMATVLRKISFSGFVVLVTRYLKGWTLLGDEDLGRCCYVTMHIANGMFTCLFDSGAVVVGSCYSSRKLLCVSMNL